MAGWIKLYRKITDSPEWKQSTPEQACVLITLLTLANHEEKQWLWQGKKFEARPGQFVTSAKSIIEKSPKGLTRQNVRSALEKFEKLGFLTKESTKTGLLVTIENWEKYQGRSEEPNQEANHYPTISQPSANHQPTTNKKLRREEGNNKALEFFTKWQSEFGMPFLSPIAQSDLEIIADKYSFDWFCRAVDIAKKKNAKSPRYIMPIMEEWQQVFNTTGNQTPWKKLSQADQSRLKMKKIAEAEHDEGTSSGTLKDGSNGSQFDLGDW